MEAKDKAIQIVAKFTMPAHYYHSDPLCYITAKQCAKFAVDEVIDHISSAYKATDRNTNTVNFWLEVKEEIEKL